MKYVANLKEWALNVYQQFAQEDREKLRYKSFRYKNKFFVFDMELERLGVAKCHPDDKPSEAVGYGLAYARCIGIEVPQERKKVPIGTLKMGDKFVKSFDDFKYSNKHFYCVVGAVPLTNLTCYSYGCFTYTMDSKEEVYPLI